MTYEFRMPDIGEGIAEVEIIEWLIAVGDHVDEDQVVVSIETDKSIVEMPTPVAGTVSRLGANPGDTVPVGQMLFTLDPDAAEAVPAKTAASTPPPPMPSSPPASEPTVPRGADEALTTTTVGISRRVKAAPAVRRLADEHGIDLAAVNATGPGGRVSKDDIKALISVAGAPAGTSTSQVSAVTHVQPAVPRFPQQSVAQDEAGDAADTVVPLRGLRRTIAKNMTESWRNIPHIVDWRQADARQLISVRTELREAWPHQAAHLTFLPLLVKIVAAALAEHPLMNASLSPESDEYVLHGRISIGIATSTPDGLLVPVIHDADRKTIVELAGEMAELVDLTRRRKATGAQLTGGTYTVNNIGALGATMGTPIIRSPEVGILGFGRIVDTVLAVNGVPTVRPMVTLSSVGDHRLHDGDTLSAFTAHVVELIEQPARLLGTLR